MSDETKQVLCGLCGEPMPRGEEMFNYHGYSGPCPGGCKPTAPPTSEGEQKREVCVHPWPYPYISEGGAVFCGQCGDCLKPADSTDDAYADEAAKKRPVQPVSPSAEQEAYVALRSNEYLEVRWMGVGIKQFERYEKTLADGFACVLNQLADKFFNAKSASLRERIVELENTIQRNQAAVFNGGLQLTIEADGKVGCRNVRAESAEASLSALKVGNPWRCFFCDFVTADEKEAAAHFGDRDDPEEFKPICKWWARMDDAERRETLQNTIQQLNAAQLGNEEKAREIAEAVVERYFDIKDPRRGYHREQIYLICRRVLDGGKG